MIEHCYICGKPIELTDDERLLLINQAVKRFGGNPSELQIGCTSCSELVERWMKETNYKPKDQT